MAERAFWPDKIAGMDALTFFGLFAVSAMLVCYALESRSHWFVMLFAVSCVLGSAYGFLQGLGLLGALSRQMSIGHFRAQNLQFALTIHEQKQSSSTVFWRANRHYRI
jgi:hypothetical protein